MNYYLPILGYHRIGPLRADHVPTVTEETFAGQLNFIARRGYRVLSCDEIADLIKGGRPFPKKATAITFDDGYEDNWTLAWPILKRYGFSATVFVIPNELGTEGFMTWEQAQMFLKDGGSIGSHTMTHAYIPETAEEKLSYEIIQSKQVLESKLASPIRHLSYPIGGFSTQAQQLAQQAGYDVAYTTNRAVHKKRFDRYAIRRIKMTEKDRGFLRLTVKLSGYYDAFRKLPKP